MRRKTLIALVSILLFFAPLMLKGQGLSYSSVDIAVKGGLSTFIISQPTNTQVPLGISKHTGFNAGIAAKIMLPVQGLSLQPELMYITKGANTDAASDLDMGLGFIELPIAIQYGIDLILMRPFLELAPYVGYAVHKHSGQSSLALNEINRFEYGLSIGGGIDVGRIQLKANYSWSFGQLTENIDTNFRGFQLSLAYFFI